MRARDHDCRQLHTVFIYQGSIKMGYIDQLALQKRVSVHIPSTQPALTPNPSRSRANVSSIEGGTTANVEPHTGTSNGPVGISPCVCNRHPSPAQLLFVAPSTIASSFRDVVGCQLGRVQRPSFLVVVICGCRCTCTGPHGVAWGRRDPVLRGRACRRQRSTYRRPRRAGGRI